MRKRIICLVLSAIMLFGCSMPASAVSIDITKFVEIISFSPNVDYSAEMHKCLEDGSPYAIQMGRLYELQRNLKIKMQGLSEKYPPTYYFQNATTADEVRAAIEEAKRPKYTEDDLYWLSMLVNREMGANWVPDQIQRDVASVVINNSKLLNKSIKDTVHTPGKYGGYFYGTPTEKVKRNCKWVLDNGTTLPSYVIGQSQAAWGPVYKSYYDPYMRTTTYFWYVRGTDK